MTETLKVTLVKSGIGRNKKIRRTLIGLGLTRMHRTVVLNTRRPFEG
jgi:large subunit ribosomal protein L30